MSTHRVGLLGGTFDPPHLGHLIAADEVRVALGLDEVRLLVAGDPWMKTRATPAHHRVRMAALAVEGDPDLAVDDRETGRHGPTYTAETLEELHHEQPGIAWYFLLGADAVAKLPDWHRAEEAVARATFVAMTRPGYGLALEHPLQAQVQPVEVTPIDISSTELRRRIAAGGSVRYQIPRAVERYIREHGLYLPGP